MFGMCLKDIHFIRLKIVGKKESCKKALYFLKLNSRFSNCRKKKTLSFYIFSAVYVTRKFVSLHMGFDVFLLEFTPGPNGYLLE